MGFVQQRLQAVFDGAAAVGFSFGVFAGEAADTAGVGFEGAQMDELGFGNCTNQYECSAACPKGISQDFIARMNRDYLAASFREAFSAKSESTAGGA